MGETSGPGSYFDYMLDPFVNFDEYINGYTLTNYAYLAKGISYDRSYDFYVKDFTGIEYFTNLQHLYLVMEQEKDLDFKGLENMK